MSEIKDDRSEYRIT